MKMTIHQHPYEGFEPTAEIKIFSPIDNPEVCVMAQRFSQSRLIVNPLDMWVVIPTERVEKLKIVQNPPLKPNPNEQIQNEHPSGRRHD